MAALAKGGAGTRALLVAVVVMGVAIVAGVAFLGLTILRRMAGPVPVSTVAIGELVLKQPAGSRIVSVATTADRLAVLLQGGGTDRVVVIDPHTGQITGGFTLQLAAP